MKKIDIDAHSKQREKEQRISITTTTPSVHVSPNTKLSNEMTEKTARCIENLTDTESTSKVLNFPITFDEGKPEEIQTRVVVEYDHDNITVSDVITAYDRSVFDAVCSFVYNPTFKGFTLNNLYREMTGSKKRITHNQLAKMEHAIDKMRFIKITIRCRDEMDKRGIDEDDIKKKGYCLSLKKRTDHPEDDLTLEGYYLPLEKYTASLHGKETIWYKILSEPILMVYALLTKQLITVPQKIRDIQIDSTSDRVLILDYLIRRIARMKNPKSGVRSKRIKFESIFKECDIDPGAHRHRYLDVVYNILDYWKTDGVNFIKDYQKVTDGNRNIVAAIEIVL